MYANKTDQRRADLAYYHRNAETIAERRASRRAALAAIRADEIAAETKREERYQKKIATEIKWSSEKRFSPVNVCVGCGKFALDLSFLEHKLSAKFGDFICTPKRIAYGRYGVCNQCANEEASRRNNTMQETINADIERLRKYNEWACEDADKEHAQYCDWEEDFKVDLCWFCDEPLVFIKKDYSQQVYGRAVWHCRSKVCRELAEFFGMSEEWVHNMRRPKHLQFLYQSPGAMDVKTLRDETLPKEARLPLALSLMLKKQANIMRVGIENKNDRPRTESAAQ